MSESLEKTAEKKQHSLEDVGTRYEHLQDHYEGLVAAAESLKKRANTPEAKATLIKITQAAEVMKATIDSYAGLTDTTFEYKMYRLLKSIPKDPNAIEGGRGTALI